MEKRITTAARSVGWLVDHLRAQNIAANAVLRRGLDRE